MSSAAEYWIGPTIGEGAFGHVVYAVHKSTNREVAIKVVDVPTATNGRGSFHKRATIQQKTAMVLNERRILSLQELKSSRWIVDLWAAFCGSASASSRCLYFVMQLATGGDLAGLIKRGLASDDRSLWRKHSVPWYASQLIEAVDFLHSRGILHCDLKPENVLLDATKGHLVLADFGSAVDTNLKPHEEQQQQQHEQQQQQQPPIPRGTALYASPEVLRASSPFGFTAAVDHWSVGCILHAMVHGKSPFDRGSESLTVRAIFGYCGGAGGTAKDEGPAGSALATGERLEAETIPDEIDEELAFTTERNTKTEEADEQDLLQLLSQELLAVIPEERISAWKNGARSFLSSKSQDVDGNCKDGGSDQPDEIESQSSVAASAGKNVLLPVPEWQEQVANATLRDGSLGWLVFEV